MPKEVTKALYAILEAQKSVIDGLPEEVGDWRMGGRYNTFTFFDKKISSRNTTRRTREKIECLEESCVECALQQNLVLDIFDSVYPLLRPFELKVKSWNIFYLEWMGISNTFDENESNFP